MMRVKHILRLFGFWPLAKHSESYGEIVCRYAERYAEWWKTPFEEVGRMRVYSLFDVKLREYGVLILARNDEAIRRAVLDGLKGSGSLQDKHPEDFHVMTLGTFDTDTGVLRGGSPTLVDSLKSIYDSHVSDGVPDVKVGDDVPLNIDVRPRAMDEL